MICSHCGTDTVTWRGPLSNLTHTECSRCGRVNCQRAEFSEDEANDHAEFFEDDNDHNGSEQGE